MQHVRIVSTGGTIASTSNEGDSGGTGDPDGETGDAAGKTPSVTGDDLVDAVPGLADEASIDVDDVCQVSGFQVTFEHAARIVNAVERAAAEGAAGVVVTHGTDTMAESAYYADLVVDAEIPVVFTGAQRPFDQLGTDGPTNLLTAVRAAAHERFRAAGGSYLAFNDRVHAARWVVKGHTSKLETFTSPTAGPIAERTPDGFRFLREPGRYSNAVPGARIDPDVRVELVMNAMGVDGRQVKRALEDADADAIVVAGTGLGNTTGELGAALEDAIERGVPVVLASRCHAGTTAGLYGGPGGGKTLRSAGAISGGDLPAWKARIRTALAVSAADDAPADVTDRVRAAFADVESIA
ncbi:asparaginase [Natronorubrum sp. JWXQ-INN-674]|uniref:Asparaginase n=1 Tax=Natronorubrum halalkaliphilum TaxID=2691917 RepID=A0A6B0VN01_9EURY|nr:asparaginase [Natronorubrum halalkaliphilum]MXV62914.1 asparaginase [Natronorubrum halalkaliphilum]